MLPFSQSVPHRYMKLRYMLLCKRIGISMGTFGSFFITLAHPFMHLLVVYIEI